jgi:hypothetical protein
MKYEGKDVTVLWEPQPRQAAALECPAYEVFYGGAAGAGKSDFLLADYAGGVPLYGSDWRGILFRRTYPELEEIILRGKELYLPVGASYHEQKKTFTFRNGAFLRLRSLEREDDVLQYQGHQYTWIGFDELPHYPTDFCWTYMSSRCRSAAGVPCYMRATGNPGGPGHAWIKNRFIDGFEPDVIYKDGEGISHCFIPARLEDNHRLMEKDPGYVRRLERLPEYLRRALREGDWDVIAGQYFDEWRREKHVVKPFALEQGAWYKFYAFDYGYNKPYALVKLGVSGDGKMVQYGERYGCKAGEVNTGIKKPSVEIAAEAKRDADLEGVTELVADPACWNKQDAYPAPIDAFVTAGFHCVKANNDRVPGWMKLHELLKTEDEYGRPMLQIFDTCVHQIRTLPILMPDDHRPEDVNSDMEDHLADALRYGVMSQTARYPMYHLQTRQGIMTPPKRRDTLRDNGF